MTAAPLPGSGDERSARRTARILGLAIPAIGTLIADPLLGFVDTAVAGRIGTAELGALGLAVAVLATVSWVFNFLVYGTTATVARAIGAGDREAAGRRVAHAAVVAAGLGFVVAGLIAAAAEPLLRAFGAVEELVDPATTYLRIRAVGVPFLLLGYVGHGAFRGISDTRTPLVIVIVANVINGALDAILVFGLGFGLGGVAWATVAAEVTAVVVFALLLRRMDLPLAGHGLPDRDQLRALAAVSRDLFIRTGSLLLGLLAVTAAAARIGTVTAAAHQVLWQVWILISFLLDGFAIAAQAMIGTALGADDPAEARSTARELVRWGMGAGVIISALLLAGVPVIPGLLTDDAAVLMAAGSVWWLAMGGHVLNGVVFVLDGVFMGASDFAYLRTWTLVSAVVAAVLAQVAVVLDWGLLGMWVAMEAMLLVRFASLTLRLRGDVWMTTGSSA